MEAKMRLIDPFSVCTTPIEIAFESVILGSATGFFHTKNSRTYLIINWHVFSGREPDTGQPKSKDYLVPDRITFEYHYKPDPMRIYRFRINLMDSNDIAIWYQHKIHGQRVDIAVLDISAILEAESLNKRINIQPFPINDVIQVSDMQHRIGQDVFILGYPLKIMKTGLFPVWKRGSIATEYNLDIDGLPCFLVDTATKEGMSGSPVIARSFGSYVNMAGSRLFSTNPVDEFLGVYSGRYVGRIDEAHLGIIWKKQLIDEIIDDPALGDFNIMQS
jgi:hypothetical protein